MCDGRTLESFDATGPGARGPTDQCKRFNSKVVRWIYYRRRLNGHLFPLHDLFYRRQLELYIFGTRMIIIISHETKYAVPRRCARRCV